MLSKIKTKKTKNNVNVIAVDIESGSLIDLPSDVVAPSSVAASAAIRPLKRKPVKNRPQSTSKISPTTAPIINQMEDDDGEISESPTTVASITTTDPATTSTVTTRKRKPVFDYVKGNLP